MKPALIAAAVALALPVLANEPKGVTTGEISMLPPYCADKHWEGHPPANESRRAHWAQVLGRSWEGLHHYCWGQVSMHRVRTQTAPAHVKEAWAREAIGDYVYTLNNATPDFVLRPEIMLRMGEAQVYVKDLPGATSSFLEAIRLKRDYWPPYARLADLYLQNIQSGRAEAILKEGLEAMPDQPVLTARLRDLQTAGKSRPRTAKESDAAGK